MDWLVLSFLKDNCQDFWLHPLILKTVHWMLGYNTTSLDTVHKCKCTSKIYKPWLTKHFFGPVKMTCDEASTGYLQLALGKTDFLQCLQLVIMMIKVHYNNPSRGSCHRQLLSANVLSTLRWPGWPNLIYRVLMLFTLEMETEEQYRQFTFPFNEVKWNLTLLTTRSMISCCQSTISVVRQAQPALLPSAPCA